MMHARVGAGQRMETFYQTAGRNRRNGNAIGLPRRAGCIFGPSAPTIPGKRISPVASSSGAVRARVDANAGRFLPHPAHC
jgi:hypothetical protein